MLIAIGAFIPLVTDSMNRLGSTELFQLREDYQKKFGVIKDWKTFHDRMLSFGSPAPRYVRELMGV